ncbi:MULTISPECIES: hypothetical protein [unclassified Streptomyces]|uniref:hypothetical protein n=1 Tax=unclassified Streptomyces TaxID=2593676 RepID=UPI00093B6D97|nr:hypothetical protein [Streptomyces sp. TSRI0107]
MSDLDFYAHVAAHRDVLGAGLGSSPAAWEAAVGADFLDVPGRGFLRRDYGLVEVTFMPTGDRAMACTGFGVQIHRLIHDRSATIVPTRLSHRYGAFRPRVGYEELRAVLLSMGRTVRRVEAQDRTGHVHRYSVAESGARVYVIADADPYGSGDHDPDDPDEHQVGDVWSMHMTPSGT